MKARILTILTRLATNVKPARFCFYVACVIATYFAIGLGWHHHRMGWRYLFEIASNTQSSEDLAKIKGEEKDKLTDAAFLLTVATSVLTIILTLAWRAAIVLLVSLRIEISRKQFSKIFAPFLPTLIGFYAFLIVIWIDTYRFHEIGVLSKGITSYLHETSPVRIGYLLIGALAATVIYIFSIGREPYCELLDEYDQMPKSTSIQPAHYRASYYRFAQAITINSQDKLKAETTKTSRDYSRE